MVDTVSLSFHLRFFSVSLWLHKRNFARKSTSIRKFWLRTELRDAGGMSAAQNRRFQPPASVVREVMELIAPYRPQSIRFDFLTPEAGGAPAPFLRSPPHALRCSPESSTSVNDVTRPSTKPVCVCCLVCEDFAMGRPSAVPQANSTRPLRKVIPFGLHLCVPDFVSLRRGQPDRAFCHFPVPHEQFVSS